MRCTSSPLNFCPVAKMHTKVGPGMRSHMNLGFRRNAEKIPLVQPKKSVRKKIPTLTKPWLSLNHLMVSAAYWLNSWGRDGGNLRRLTFELTGARRQDALARLAKMYRVPPTGPRWPAVARPVARGVRPACAHWER